MAESKERTSSNAVHSTVLTYSPIITKVDAPLEDSVLENEKNEEVAETSVLKICSATTGPNALSRNPFNSSVRSSILKPPQLNLTSGGSSGSSKTFALNPPKLNPFVKKIDDIDDKKEESTNGEAVKFVPLLNQNKQDSLVEETNINTSLTSTATTFKTSSVASTSFVFGQNLQERVVSVETKNDEPLPSTSLNTNGTTDMLFSNAIKNDVKSNTNNSNKEIKSLSESAREYEESRAVKRKYEEVEVKTGEEEENNILCISCKLFSFDGVTGSWQERGRGTLRLNDFLADNRTQSRLVFRTSGSLRVILNTKIFAKMKAEKASDRSIRLTAIDAKGEIKVFLVTASNEDSKSLHQALEERIKLEVDASKCEER
ncbi:hypothetical protein WA026_017283 [Henosepilachna vigintioctopunctata]|uniref:RanBD1 domain-containing protein n=1 Tax=Henosepilachna vigintioctopunctata TaxID=420089 RepID=A0AAW1UFG2_9CUCU